MTSTGVPPAARRTTHLVLLPGMDGTGQLFAPLAAALGPAFTLQIVRYPVDRPAGYADLVSMARSELPRDRPYVLLGESFSGPIAVTLAAEAPVGLKALVLCCSFVRSPHPWMAWLRPLVGWLPVKALPVRVLAWSLFGRASNAAWRSTLTRILAPVSPAVMRARLRAVLAVDVSPAWAQVAAPTLCLTAAEDRLVPAAATRWLTSLRPGVQVVDLPGPHGLLQVAPHGAARAIQAFVSSLAK
ncbi:MAG TPA: alpha/beta hydrolase [Ideonella sp.]|uniref:alpha/beta fold hydrolase n=1 Tax=Ideonella sp. TaxID=1929293 RepID=UPI002E37819A|nr:alpha/beta hydrolase [Ideonella sp.]HEX5686853.1 alpha/beta hydrolase [Ideonella sp.]